MSTYTPKHDDNNEDDGVKNIAGDIILVILLAIIAIACANFIW